MSRMGVDGYSWEKGTMLVILMIMAIPCCPVVRQPRSMFWSGCNEEEAFLTIISIKALVIAGVFA